MQYNASNAWNVNTNTGNANNNDKSNTNRVRGIAEYRNMISRYLVPLFHIIEAYFHCRRSKRGTYNALEFELNWMRNCIKLWRDINDRTYKIGRSICFIVNKPTKREVFAACFRDRIVHHFICMRLEPLFEEYLYPCMKSNRKGKGTSDAINEVFDITSKNHSGRIYKFDLQGFFMSIDKRVLWNKLKDFIIERYKRDDIGVLLWLAELTIMHCPQNNCLRKCSLLEWAGLALNKSLFGQDKFHGLPIGNLISQMLANFLLKLVLDYLYKHGVKDIVQYVDDFFCILDDDVKLGDFIPNLRAYLKSIGITLHPRKSYIQHISKGVTFLGAKINPYRVYTSNRTIGNAYRKLHWMLKNNIEPERFRDCINSYLGYMRHSSSYKIRKNIAENILQSRKEFYFTNDFEKIMVKKKYTRKFKIINRLRKTKAIRRAV